MAYNPFLQDLLNFGGKALIARELSKSNAPVNPIMSQADLESSANRQARYGQQALDYSLRKSQPDQYTPGGRLVYDPQTDRLVTTLSPREQAIFDQEQRARFNYGRIAGEQQQSLYDMVKDPLDTSGLTPRGDIRNAPLPILPGFTGANRERDRVYDDVMGRFISGQPLPPQEYGVPQTGQGFGSNYPQGGGTQGGLMGGVTPQAGTSNHNSGMAAFDRLPASSPMEAPVAASALPAPMSAAEGGWPDRSTSGGDSGPSPWSAFIANLLGTAEGQKLLASGWDAITKAWNTWQGDTPEGFTQSDIGDVPAAVTYPATPPVQTAPRSAGFDSDGSSPGLDVPAPAETTQPVLPPVSEPLPTTDNRPFQLAQIARGELPLGQYRGEEARDPRQRKLGVDIDDAEYVKLVSDMGFPPESLPTSLFDVNPAMAPERVVPPVVPPVVPRPETMPQGGIFDQLKTDGSWPAPVTKPSGRAEPVMGRDDDVIRLDPVEIPRAREIPSPVTGTYDEAIANRERYGGQAYRPSGAGLNLPRNWMLGSDPREGYSRMGATPQASPTAQYGLLGQLPSAGNIISDLDATGSMTDPTGAYLENYEEEILKPMQRRLLNDRKQEENSLLRRGIGPDSSLWKRNENAFNQRMDNARLAANREAFSRGFQVQGRDWQQALGRGQFANQAQQQGYQQLLGRGQFGLQGQGQQYGQDAGRADMAGRTQQADYDRQRNINAYNARTAQQNFENQQARLAGMTGQRAGELQERQALRTGRLNEQFSLGDRNQVNMPQFQRAVAGRYSAPNLMGYEQEQSRFDTTRGDNQRRDMYNTFGRTARWFGGGGFGDNKNNSSWW